MKTRIVLFSAALAVLAGTARSSPRAARPNIVLIMADDMGFSDIGCYGAGTIKTPNIDRLAGEGMRFTQFYNNAKCTTTRASLLTGLYPRNGGRGIADLITTEMLTLGEGMQLAGYRTVLSGKWHNGSGPGKRPYDRGFEEAYGLWDGCSNFFDPSRPDPQFKGGRVRFFGHNAERITEFPDDFFTTEAFADHSISTIRRFVAETPEKPFFAYLPFTAPHYPLHARPDEIAAYDGKFAEGWEVLHRRRHERAVELGVIDAGWKLPAPDPEVEPWEDAKDKKWQNLRMETYAAMVTAMDREIGGLLDALDDLGVAENTLVLFLSDNGSCAETPGGNDPGQVPGPEEYYSHVGPGWAYAQNSPFRRYKVRMHEGGIATPLIARWPVAIEAGSLTKEPGHIIDFFPTFLDLARIEYPESFGGNTLIPVEGRSLFRVLSGIGPREPHPALYWFFNGNRAIRKGDWKLVWDGHEKRWELYDLAADRTETNDLAAGDPERVAGMRAEWEKWARSTGVKF